MYLLCYLTYNPWKQVSPAIDRKRPLSEHSTLQNKTLKSCLKQKSSNSVECKRRRAISSGEPISCSNELISCSNTNESRIQSEINSYNLPCELERANAQEWARNDSLNTELSFLEQKYSCPPDFQLIENQKADNILLLCSKHESSPNLTTGSDVKHRNVSCPSWMDMKGSIEDYNNGRCPNSTIIPPTTTLVTGVFI